MSRTLSMFRPHASRRRTVSYSHQARKRAEAVPQIVRMRGGIRVVVQSTPTPAVGQGTVSLQLWVLVGTADEGPKEHGCAHLLEHMVFKPLTFAGQQWDLAAGIEALGGDVNAFTSQDETVFHATVPVANYEAAVRQLLVPIVHANPQASHLEQEAQVVIEEIKQYDDDPGARVSQDMLERLYAEHGYGRPVLGLAKEIRQHSPATLRRFLKRHYGGDRLALVVVGPLSVERVVAAAKPILAAVRSAPISRRPRAPRPMERTRVTVRREDVHEAHLSLGWSAPAWPQRDAVALEIAANALGGGESSWLAVGLRRRQALVTDAHATVFVGRQTSTFVVGGHGLASKLEPAVNEIERLLSRLREQRLDDEEIARARAVLESDVVYRRETVSGQAHILGYYLSLADRIDLDRQYQTYLSEIDADEIRRACTRWLTPNSCSVAVVVPQHQWSRADATALSRRIEKTLSGRERRTKTKSTVRVDRHGIYTARLRCGLRVRMSPDASVPMVAGWLAWPGGQRLESIGISGSTALAAALLTRGTAQRDGDTLTREIEGCAAVLDGVGGRNSVGLHFECLSRDSDTLMRRLLECALEPCFAAPELEQERRLALEDLAAERDDLGTIAMQVACGKLYGNHPFGRRRRGDAQTLRRLSSASLTRLWRQHYPLAGACLGLCGDFNPQRWIQELDSLLGSVGAAAPPFVLPGAGPRYGRATTIRRRRAKEQAHVAMVAPGLCLDDPATPTLEVLTTILGGQVGRLFMNLREEQGLVYHASASSVEGLDAGHVALYAAASQDKVARARSAMVQECERLGAQPPGAQELERAQAYLIGQAEAALQRRGRVASLLALNEIYGLGYAAHLAYGRKIARVRPRDVQVLARRLLDPQRFITAIVAA